MKRLLLLLPLLIAAPASAQVDPAVHKLCSDVKDYSGCVQTQLSLSKKAKPEPKTVATSEPSELTPWQVHLNENPSLKAWVEANPTLGSKKRQEWEKNSKNRNGALGFSWGITEDEKTKAEIDECIKIGGNWSFEKKDPSGNIIWERGCTAKTYDAASSSSSDQNSQCPPGTQMYRTRGLFGLGARDLGCMTAYEAESLNRQTLQNIQQNIQNNLNRTRNCSTSFIGNTAYTNCY